MKSLFEKSASTEIINRVKRLNVSLKPEWGKMNVAQMLAHCSSFLDIAMGYSNPKRGWLGILIGRFVKPVFYNNKPLARNMSTIPTILISDERNFETEKENLMQQILKFQHNGEEKCTTNPHPFFGRLTPQQWGKGMYKHLDHHLRQFNV